MSTVDHGPDSQPSGDVTRAIVDVARDWWTDAMVTALLALADFAAFVWMLLHLVSQFQHVHNDVARNANYLLSVDLARPLAAWMWFLILLDGIVLCLRPRTRAVGVGLLLAAAVIAVPVAVWVLWWVVTFATG